METAVFGSDMFSAVIVAQVDVADSPLQLLIDFNRLQPPGSQMGGVHCQVGELDDFFDGVPVPEVPTTAETMVSGHVFNA